MKNFNKSGVLLSLIPAAAVAGGVGYQFGTALFGVAAVDVASGVEGEFLTEGVVEIAKTSALAIGVGDMLYWDPAAKVVNKTTAGQRAVGVAVAAAANPSATVLMKIGTPSLAGT